MGNGNAFTLCHEDPQVNLYLPILQSIKAHLHLIDREFRIQWANDTGANCGSRFLSGLKGRFCYEVYLGRTAPCQDCPVRVVFNSHRPHTTEKWISMPDGSQRCFEARVYPICDNSAKSVYAIKMGFDVTDKKLAGEKHLEYVEALEISLRAGIEDVHRARTDSRAEKDLFNLSKREIQVLRLMSEGFSNIEISKDLDVSPHTVKTHVTHILNKIGASDRTQAAVLAARLGII